RLSNAIEQTALGKFEVSGDTISEEGIDIAGKVMDELQAVEKELHEAVWCCYVGAWINKQCQTSLYGFGGIVLFTVRNCAAIYARSRNDSQVRRVRGVPD